MKSNEIFSFLTVSEILWSFYLTRDPTATWGARRFGDMMNDVRIHTVPSRPRVVRRFDGYISVFPVSIGTVVLHL